MPALEMNVLFPLITYSVPWSRAVVAMAAMSEPASGSVIAKAAIARPRTASAAHRSCIAWLPLISSGKVPRA